MEHFNENNSLIIAYIPWVIHMIGIVIGNLSLIIPSIETIKRNSIKWIISTSVLVTLITLSANVNVLYNIIRNRFIKRKFY